MASILNHMAVTEASRHAGANKIEPPGLITGEIPAPGMIINDLQTKDSVKMRQVRTVNPMNLIKESCESWQIKAPHFYPSIGAITYQVLTLKNTLNERGRPPVRRGKKEWRIRIRDAIGLLRNRWAE
jgi:hypothetical protein